MFRSLQLRLLSLGVLFTFPGLAQPLIPERNQLPPVQYHNALPVEASARPVAGQQTLVARSRYVYDHQGFRLVDSVQYQYHAATTRNRDAAPVPVEQITRSAPLAGPGSRDRRSVQTFTAQHRPSTFLQQRWDTLRASWVDQCRQSFSYRHGMLTGDSSWNMNDETGSWIPAGISVYDHDSAGRVTRTRSLNRNEQGRLVVVSDLQYRFDKDGNVMECISRDHSGNPSGRRTVTYSAGGHADGLFYERRDPASDAWKKSYGYAFASARSGNRSAQFNLQWNETRAGWDTLAAYTYEYSKGRLQTMTVWKGAPGKASSGVVDIYEYAYNAEGQRISAARKAQYDDPVAGAAFGPGAEKLLFYYEPLVPGPVSDLQHDDLRIWPVPASGLLHMDIRTLQGDSYHASITDMQGRVVRSWCRPSGVGSTDQTCLSGVSAGTYNLLLQAKNGKVYTKRFAVTE